MAENHSTNRPTERTTPKGAFIQKRTAELLAAGWHSPALATKRASREWRVQSPQHKAAAKRNAQMAGARLQRMAELPVTDATWRTIEVQA